MLTVLITKLVATAVVVIGVSITVGKLGPRLGGILAGTPVILGPGYFFMLQEWPPEFIRAAALSSLHALIATLLFVVSFVVTAKRLSALASLAVATLLWIPAALLFSRLPGGLGIAVTVYGIVLLLAEWIRRALDLKQPTVVSVSGWSDLLLRGVMAGILVSVATTLAVNSGPTLSGMLVGFPVALFTIGWTLHDRYGADVARATVSAAQMGMLSLVAFTVVTAILVGVIAPMLTFLFALLASMSVSGSLLLLSQWRVRRAYSHLLNPDSNNKGTPSHDRK
ncbi:MAG: hypothetical protein WD623_15415 [Marinobacter sp.]|uniref:hypothetical protein n=1 Tax=Marinobacter sp. TaxID=50741 RepID=UPI00349FE107